MTILTNSQELRKLVNLASNHKFVNNFFFKITFKIIGTHHLTFFT